VISLQLVNDDLITHSVKLQAFLLGLDDDATASDFDRPVDGDVRGVRGGLVSPVHDDPVVGTPGLCLGLAANAQPSRCGSLVIISLFKA
jgi:hypothetical protein